MGLRAALSGSLFSTDHIHFSGGYNFRSLDSTEIYNISNDSFASNTPLIPTALYRHCMVKWDTGNKVYLVGGVKSLHGVGTFQTGTHVFDIETCTFFTLSDQLQVARESSGCAIVDQDRTLVIAGFNKAGWRLIHSTEILNLHTNTWSAAGAIPFSGGYNLIPMEGSLYVLAQSGLFYHYNSPNDEWELLSKTTPFDGALSGQYLPINVNAASVCQFL